LQAQEKVASTTDEVTSDVVDKMPDETLDVVDETPKVDKTDKKGK